MAVTFDAVGPGSTAANSSNSTSLSWSHTCGASATYLVVLVCCNATSVTGFSMTATYNAVSMTSLGTLNLADSNSITQAFVLLNPATGAAHNVAVTVSGGTPVNMLGASLSFNGAGSSGNFTSATSNSGNPSVTLSTTTSGNMAVAFAVQNVNVTISAPSGWTQDSAGTVAATPSTAVCAAHLASTGASMTAAFGTTGSNFWGAIALEVIASVSSGPAGTVQPQATVPVPRRRPVRAVWAQITGQAFVAVPAPRQQPGPAPRRKPARAYVQFTPVTTTNAAVVRPAGSVPVLMTNQTRVVVRRDGRVVRR